MDKISDAIKSLEYDFVHDDKVAVGDTGNTSAASSKMQLAIMDHPDAPSEACLAKTYLKNFLSLVSTVLKYVCSF